MNYKEKLEEAKRLYEIANPDQKYVLKSLFPELSESEDEKIRKALINQFSDYKRRGENHGFGYSNDKILAWLEKQGEHKKFRDSIQIGDKVTRNQDGMLVNLSQLKRIAKPNETKQGEQKSTEWSEEDEDNFKHLVDEIVCLGNSRNSANRLYYDRLIKFLGELKDRAQPREEWCETEERKLDRLIAYFEDRVAFTDKDDLEYAEWLKSLKDRYTWKPSDSQMASITCAVRKMKESTCYDSELVSLLNDLKKLKG